MASVTEMNRLTFYSALLAAFSYYLFYLFFTGAAQIIQTPRIGIAGITAIITFVETQLYTGPLIQIIGDGVLINLRIYPLLIGGAVAGLVGYNAGILYTLHRRGLLRACLLGSAWSGIGGFLASVISFGYVCCGWPVSLVLFGVGAVVAVSPYLTAAAVTLLSLNAYVLTKRYQALEKPKNFDKTTVPRNVPR